MSRHISTLLLLAFVVAAIAAPWLAPENPGEIHLSQRLASPSLEAPLGRDQLGAYAGYHGGRRDLVAMRAVELIHALPGFLIALALVALRGPSFISIVIAMTVTGWTSFARLVRNEVLRLKHLDFVTAARALGASDFRIVLKHIAPHLMAPVVIQATFALAAVVIAESSLSFLGLGGDSDAPTWGALLNNGRRFLAEAPHLSLFPGLTLFVFVVSLQRLGRSLQKT